MSMPRTLAFWLQLTFLVLPGIVGMIVFGYTATIDWAALKETYQHYARVVTESPDMQTLFVAEADQNIHRMNLFADGVWTLLSVIVAAIGLHGLCRPQVPVAKPL